jgi:processing peptidase subunit beta
MGDAVTMGVYVDGGHRVETPATAGSAYVLQELAKAGSKKTPDVVAKVEGLGGLMSVTAGRESTSYTFSVPKEAAKPGFELLSDLVANPNLEAFDGLKASMVAGLSDLEFPTRDILMDRLHLCAFRDSGLGYSKVEVEGLPGLSKAALSSYHASTVAANKLVVAADGPVKHADVAKMAEAAFGGLKPVAFVPNEKPYFVGAELIYRNDEMGPTAYIAVGLEGVSWRSPEAVTFMLMAQIMGSYKKGADTILPGKISGNRITNNIANKMGVGCADEYEAFNIFYKDTGIFGFYAACDEVAVEHCLGELMLGMNVLSFSVTDEEVERAKRELKTKIFTGLDSSVQTCTDMGLQTLNWGRVMSPAELIERLDQIDAEEIKRVAFARLNDGEVAITALGPLHGMPPYFEIRRMSYMHRY